MTTVLQADYWKPIQCGEEELCIGELIAPLHVHPSRYSFKAPLSPHHAARLENLAIDPNSIVPPDRPLVIESVGGIFVPLTRKILTIDLFQTWPCTWIIVSKHYLGSINHTLLTLEALKMRGVKIAGLIFNGEPNPDSEAAILEISQLSFLGRILPEPIINRETIQRIAKSWTF